MAEATHTTRRALFAGAAILAAVPLTAMPQPSVAATWLKALAYRDVINAKNYPADPLNTELEADCAVHDGMEKAVLTGPITSRADAAAKVRCAVCNIDEGTRSDGEDFRALEQVARWLEAV